MMLTVEMTPHVAAFTDHQGDVTLEWPLLIVEFSAGDDTDK